MSYTLSGNSSVPGATINYTSTIASPAVAGSVVCDGTGAFSIPSLPNDTYVLTPSYEGWDFSPTLQDVVVNGADVSDVNFTTLTFGIFGNVGVAGATVALTGAAIASTTSATDGSFSFSNLENGSYTVTPSLLNNYFGPASETVTLLDANVTSVNFIAAAWVFLGTVSSDGSGVGPYLGHVKVIASAPSGLKNPYIGKVKLGSPTGDSSDKLIGSVVVLVTAPGSPAPDIGDAGQI
jgi:hypothetical protein